MAQAAGASGVDFLAPHKKSLKTECAPYVRALQCIVPLTTGMKSGVVFS